MENLMSCPLCERKINCGELEKLGLTSDMLADIKQLKEQGMFPQAIIVAVKIVRTVNDKPMWFKELLDETRDELRGDFEKEIRELLKILMETLGNPLKTGRIQEETIPKRLKAVKPADSFTTDNSTRIGEDVTCTVKENNEILGKIVIESKKVKKWSYSYVEQTKKYMEKQNTEFGILATTAMPSDALSYTTMVDGVTVVQIDHIEPAYIFLRQHLVLKSSLEREHTMKMKQMEIRDQVLLELKQAISNGELDDIIETVNGLTENIDTKVNRAGNYINILFKEIKTNTQRIRALMAKLISDHIEKMRLQLGITLRQ